jgi:hypothetical protein
MAAVARELGLKPHAKKRSAPWSLIDHEGQQAPMGRPRASLANLRTIRLKGPINDLKPRHLAPDSGENVVTLVTRRKDDEHIGRRASTAIIRNVAASDAVDCLNDRG